MRIEFDKIGIFVLGLITGVIAIMILTPAWYPMLFVTYMLQQDGYIVTAWIIRGLMITTGCTAIVISAWQVAYKPYVPV